MTNEDECLNKKDMPDYGLVRTSNHEPDSKRWTMLLLLSLLSGLNQGICYTYAPIATAAERRWHNRLHSTYLITIYFVTYVPFSFCGSWIIDRYGLRTGVVIGAFLQALGSTLRVFASWNSPKHDVAIIVFGQTLASLAMPFVVNTPPLLSAHWFPPRERASATSTSVNANALGIAVVYFLAPLIVQRDTDIVLWEGILASMAILLAFITYFCFQSYPKTWISSAEGINLSTDYDWHQWIDAFRHRGFWITVLSFSVSECILNTYSSLLNIFLLPVGFTRPQIGVIGALFIVSALIGSQIMCAIIGKTHAYKMVSQVCLLCSACGIAVFKFSMELPGKGNTFIALLASGFFIGPLQPVVLELGVECAFPTSEATVAALQQLCGNLMSAILVPTLSYAHRRFKDKYGHVGSDHFYACPEWILVFLLTLCSIAFIFFDGERKRYRFESLSTSPG